MEFNPDNSFFDDLALAGVSTEIPASLKRKESFDSVPLAKRAATESFNLGNAVDDVEMFAHPVPETFGSFSMVSSTDDDVILSDADIEAALSEVSSSFGDEDNDDGDLTDDSDSFDDFEDEEYQETTTKSGRVVMSKIISSKVVASKVPNKSSHICKGKSKRGNYLCSKCNLPKKGHICQYQARIRRRGGSSGTRLTPRQLQAARLARNSKNIPASTTKRFSKSSTPRMVSTGTQCEIGDSVLRSIHLDAQGFPESYANGIFADPSFCIGNAPKVVVSRPPPKNYVPPKTTSSCGSGPDSHSLKMPSSVPFATIPNSTQMLDSSFFSSQFPTASPSSVPMATDQLSTMQQLAMLMSTLQQSQGLVQDFGPGSSACFDTNLLASLLLPAAGSTIPVQVALPSLTDTLRASSKGTSMPIPTSSLEQ